MTDNIARTCECMCLSVLCSVCGAAMSQTGNHDFLFLYLDDYGEEVSVDNEEEGGSSKVPASTKPQRRRSKNTLGCSKWKRIMLNRDEKAQIMVCVCETDVDDALK